MSVAGIGNTFAKANLNQDLGSGTPATWYAELFITMPSDGTGTGAVAAAWTGYARVAVTNNSTNFPTATIVTAIATVVLQQALAFGVVAGLSASIVVTGIGLFDASTGGNMGRTAFLGTPTSPTPYTLNNGGSLTIPAAATSFQEQ
jgi:hypothetical protein